MIDIFKSELSNNWFNEYVLKEMPDYYIHNCIYNSYNSIDRKIELLDEVKIDNYKDIINDYKKIKESIYTYNVYSVFDCNYTYKGKYKYDSNYKDFIDYDLCVRQYKDNFDDIMEYLDVYKNDPYHIAEIDLISKDNKVIDNGTIYINNRKEIFRFWTDEFLDKYENIHYPMVGCYNIKYPFLDKKMMKFQLPIMKDPVYCYYDNEIWELLLMDNMTRLDIGQFESMIKPYCLYDWIDKV